MRNALVLDVDDTLVDTFATAFQKAGLVATRLGLRPLEVAEMAAVYGRLSFEECVRVWYDDLDPATYAACYDLLADEVPALPLGDGAALVECARTAGLLVGVLTNGPAGKTTRKLATVGLSPDDLDWVVDRDTARVLKPFPEAFDWLRRDHDLDPHGSWYVSDSPADWAGAHAAGFSAAGVRRHPGLRTVSGPRSARLTVPAVDDLAPILPSLAAMRADRTAPRPSVWSFDAGFTLVHHRRSPVDVVRAALGPGADTPDSEQVETALGQAASLLADKSTVWTSDSQAAEVLLAFYASVVRALAPSLPPAAVEAAAADAVEAYTAPENWRGRATSRAVLDLALATGASTAVLSNWRSDLPAVLESTGLGSGVRHVLCSAASGHAKPSPLAFEGLAAETGAGVTDVIHVGDDPLDDVVAALSVGAKAVYTPARLTDDEFVATVESAA